MRAACIWKSHVLNEWLRETGDDEPKFREKLGRETAKIAGARQEERRCKGFVGVNPNSLTSILPCSNRFAADRTRVSKADRSTSKVVTVEGLCLL